MPRAEAKTTPTRRFANYAFNGRISLQHGFKDQLLLIQRFMHQKRKVSIRATGGDAILNTCLPPGAPRNFIPKRDKYIQVTEKTFQEMYINVGMANCEKRPKQERDDIRFTHIAIPTSFYILFVILKCVFCWNMY